MGLPKSRNWKKASYPNARPSWQKIVGRSKILKDELNGFEKVKGFTTSKNAAENTARGVKAMGASKVKILKSGGGYDIYFKKSKGRKK